jgi:hypothetical protein
MDKEKILNFWRHFFIDLFTGTFKRMVGFIGAGLAFGGLAVMVTDKLLLQPGGGGIVAQWTVFLLLVCWYLTWGPVHAVAYCIAGVADRKIAEMVGGLQDLFDLLAKGALESINRNNKTYSRAELESTFDRLGKDFLDKLGLQKGLFHFATSLIFGAVMKGLKFIFVNDVLLELEKKNPASVTPADIESAVRRVGVSAVLSPIHDAFLLIHVANSVLMIVVFAGPVAVLHWFFK